MSNEKKAMNTEKKPAGHHQSDVDDLKTWLSQYGSHAITAVLTVLIVLAALHMLHTRSMNRTIEGNLRLSKAQSVSDFEGVINEFGKSAVAPLAQLSLAKLNYDNGDYELALSQYDRFLEQWPKHEMKETADLGRIFCIEARGSKEAFQEAVAAFAAFAAANPEDNLTPQALFGQARCLEQLGDLEQARTIYENFITANPLNLWSIRGEELLSSVQRRMNSEKAN